MTPFLFRTVASLILPFWANRLTTQPLIQQQRNFKNTPLAFKVQTLVVPFSALPCLDKMYQALTSADSAAIENAKGAFLSKNKKKIFMICLSSICRKLSGKDVIFGVKSLSTALRLCFRNCGSSQLLIPAL